MRVLTAAAGLCLSVAAAHAQEAAAPPGPVPPAEASPGGVVPGDERAAPPPPSGPPAASPAARPAAAATPPDDSGASGAERVFVDTRVTDVRVGNEVTVATMSQSPQSLCPSNEYVFERDRPKWLFQTGRLLQAMREGAVVRISFTCLQGYQSINAIQFVSPPQAALAEGTPRPGEVLRVAPQPAAGPDGAPPPADGSLTPAGRPQPLPPR